MVVRPYRVCRCKLFVLCAVVNSGSCLDLKPNEHSYGNYFNYVFSRGFSNLKAVVGTRNTPLLPQTAPHSLTPTTYDPNPNREDQETMGTLNLKPPQKYVK